MKTFAANLKTLYQCPAIWFWHLLGTVLCIPLAIRPLVYPEPGKGYFCGFIPVAFWFGIIVASLTKDILIKPFAFCLPGQVRIARRYLFLTGAAVSGTCALTLLAYPGITTGRTLAAVVTAFTLGLALYAVTALAIMAIRNFGPVPLIYLIFLYAMYDEYLESTRAGMERFVLDHPLAFTVPSLAALVLVWRSLGRRSLARRLCAMNFLPIFSLFNVGKLMRFHEEEKNRRFTGRPSPLMTAVERFSLARMKGQCRHFWGSLYNIAGGMAPVNPVRFLLLVLMVLAGTAVLGYYVPKKHPLDISVANLVLLAPVCGIGNGMNLNLFSTLLLPVSRRGRFRTLVATYLAGMAACALLCLPIIAASKLFGQVGPQLSLSGETYTYLQINVKSMFYILLLVPLLLCCQILFPRFFTISSIIVTSVFVITYIKTIEGFLALSPASIALLHIVFSIPFIALALYHACSRDLVLKG